MFKNGTEYWGNYKDGKLDGVCLLYKPDGTRDIRTFINGEVQSEN